MTAGEGFREIFDLTLEKSIDGHKKIKPTRLIGDIEFKNVNFRYVTRQLILKKINFNIHNGEKIALIGESGPGKTTIVKLLMNFYQCEKGEILINGYNIKDIHIGCLLDKIAYISQGIFPFNRTIIDNLTLGNPYITYEEIIIACKKAQIHNFINSQPLRYNIIIEENGLNLSGGQK